MQNYSFCAELQFLCRVTVFYAELQFLCRITVSMQNYSFYGITVSLQNYSFYPELQFVCRITVSLQNYSFYAELQFLSGLGMHSFQKNATFLYSFAIFIKERGVLCVLLCSL